MKTGLSGNELSNLITFVCVEKVYPSRFLIACDTMSGHKGHRMKLPFLNFSSTRPGKLSRKDAKVFAEACQLALLRLEQCIADSYISVPRMDDRRIDGWMPMPQRTQEPLLGHATTEINVLALRKEAPAATYGREVI